MKRRAVLATAGSVATIALAGCLGVAGMDEHEASPAGVDQDVRADTGYEQVSVDELAVRRSVGLAGYSEEVVVTNYLTEHEKSVSLGPIGEQRAAVFVVLTTPQISLAGRQMNPIDGYSAEELIDLIEDNYDDISNVRHDRDEPVTILGQETVRARFEADARFDGHDVPVYVHVSESVQTASDHLITLGVYPQPVSGSEADNVVALMEGVVESVDREGGDDEGERPRDGDDEGERPRDGDDDDDESETTDDRDDSLGL